MSPRVSWRAEFLLFFSSFTFYLGGVSPALYGGDAGEFIASAHALGLPHAPGYPTYNLLAHGFYTLLPWGNIPYRINVVSALISAVTVVIFFFVLKKLFNSKIGAIGAFLLATTPLFVEQSRAAEVFGLNLLFLFGIFLALQTERLALACLLFGLGLGNHQTLLIAAPFLVYAAWLHRAEPAPLVLAVGALVLGLGIYLYLPLRAAHNPPVNFGDPETWQRFWAVVTRKEFGHLTLHPAAVPFRSFELVQADTLAFFNRLRGQIGWSGLLFMLIGVSTVFHRPQNKRPVMIGLYFLLAGLGFELLSNLSPGSDIGQWRLERFLLLPLVGALVLMGTALVNRSRWLVVLALFVFFSERLIAWPAFVNLRDNFIYRDFAVSALRSVPTGKLVVIDRVLFDEPASALLVTTQVEKKRPDVRFLYRPGTLFNAPYGDDFLELSWDQRFERQKQIEKKLVAEAAPPVSALAFEKKNVPFENARLNGLLYSSSSSINGPLFLVNRRSGRDYPRRLMAVHFPYFLGKAALERGEESAAEEWFREALLIGSDMAWLHSNVGGLWAQTGRVEKSRRLFEKAVRLDPYFAPAHFGLGFTALKTNDMDVAVEAYERALQLDPTNNDVRYMLDVAKKMAGRN